MIIGQNAGVIKSQFGETPGVSPADRGDGVTLVELATAKALPYDFLRKNFWLQDDSRRRSVVIPYRGPDRQELFCRERVHLSGGRHTMQPAGTELRPYGWWRLDEFRTGGRLIVAEGESDVWAGWFHGLPVLGVPGANAVGKCLSSCLSLLTEFTEVFVWREPDGGGETFVAGAGRVLAKVPGLTARVLSGAAAGGAKDLSALHMANPDPAAFQTAFDAILAAAEPMPVVETARASAVRVNPYAEDHGCDGVPLDVRIRRLIAYLSKLPPSVQGSNGSNDLMRAARACHQFGVDRETSVGVLRDHFNPRCQPEWSNRELKHKIDDAWKTATTAFGCKLTRSRDDYQPRRSEMDGLGALTDPAVFESLNAPRAERTSAAVGERDLSDLAGPRVADPRFRCPVAVVEPTPALAAVPAPSSIPAAFAPKFCQCQNPCCVALRGAAGSPVEGTRAVIDVRGKGWQCCDDCRAWNQSRWASWLRRVASWWANPGRAAAAGIAPPADAPYRPHNLYVAAVEPDDWSRVKKQLDRCDGLYATIATVGGCVDVPSLLLRDKEQESGDTAHVLYVLERSSRSCSG